MRTKKITIFLLTCIMLLTSTSFGFAEVRVPDCEQSVTVYTDGPQARRACLFRGMARLTQVSGRTLAIEGEVYGYHNVDRIGLTIYLEKATASGSTIVKSWSADELNADYAEVFKAYTVSSAGNYRLTGVFSTSHDADGGGIEGASASTSWMWVD